MTYPPEIVAKLMSVRCSNIVTLGMVADQADQYDAITRELRAIEALDDRSGPMPLLFQAAVAMCELTLDVDPPPPCAAEHDHPTTFTLIDPETGGELDIDSAPPQLRWAARFLWAARQKDGATVAALWRSFPDAQAYTKGLVQLAVVVGMVVRANVDKLDLDPT